MIARRRTAGWVAGILLAAGLALVLMPTVTLESWLGLSVPVGVEQPSPMTVRLPTLGKFRDPASGRVIADSGRIVVARGDNVTAQRHSLYQAALPAQGLSVIAVIGLFVGFFLIGLLLVIYWRTSARGKRLRTQAIMLATICFFVAASKALLLFTSVSSFLLPVAAVALVFRTITDRHAALAGALALSFLLAATGSSFDAPMALVLSVQAIAALLLPLGRRRNMSLVLAGLVGACAATAAYVSATFLFAHELPFAELSDPLRSSLVAAFVGGFISGPLAIVLRPLVQWIGGEVTRSKLIAYTDLENPLLKRIERDSPGTWQHSLAMANMAEIAANAIGADALLARVGAYYHDLGKSLQPAYFIENTGRGQPSPHDDLAPQVSADAIFSHVTEGVRIAREAGLPEAIVDFMHMHHGNGYVEYFWGKCVEAGNPHNLTIADFRYPGVIPQSRETGILAICDAVEAASRSLKDPDAAALEDVVRRIVHGKLQAGQLDESGLTMLELRLVSETLVEIVKHAHHVRIEYPWQKEARARSDSQVAAAPPAPTAPPARTARVSGEHPVIDSIEIELMNNRRASQEHAVIDEHDGDDGLTPGHMIIGAPPATHPEQTQTRHRRRPPPPPRRGES